MTDNPEQLFELFFKNVRDDMHPYFLKTLPNMGLKIWWYQRFMYAYHGIQEPKDLRSWAEAPQMWLAGYYENHLWLIDSLRVNKFFK